MYDKAPYKVTSAKNFELKRKNGSTVVWEFKNSSGQEAFRVDKPIYGMRLAKV